MKSPLSQVLPLVLLVSNLLILPARSAEAKQAPPPFSTLTAVVKWGPRETTYHYTRRETAHASQLRIVNQRKELPTPPYNLIDLRTGEVTILYPHNGTYMRVPAERFALQTNRPAGFPEIPALPPGIGPQTPPLPPKATPVASGKPTPPPWPAPVLPDGVKLPPGIGPQASPGPPGSSVPRPPAPTRIGPTIPLPDWVQLPPGIGPGAAPPPSPREPATPGLPPDFNVPAPPLPAPGFGRPPQAPLALSKTDQSREIHRHSCTLYTLDDPRRGSLEIWATESLGPFYLLATSPPRPQRHPEFLEIWPALLREKGLFPLLVTLRQGEIESFRFEITALHPDPAPAMAAPFPIPPNFHQTELPPF